MNDIHDRIGGPESRKHLIPTAKDCKEELQRRLAETTKKGFHTIISDQDCHKYIVPESIEEECKEYFDKFYALVDGPNPDEAYKLPEPKGIYANPIEGEDLYFKEWEVR